MNTKIACPNCHFEFDVDEVLAKNAEERLEREIREKLQQHYQEELQTATQKFQTELSAREKKLQETLSSEQKKLEESLQQKYQNQHDELTQKLQAERQKIKSRDEQLEKLRAETLEHYKQKDAWEQEKKNLELETQKKLLAEREKLEEELSAKLADAHKLKLAEKDKKIADFETKVAELQRKLEQGSQQLQGEVLELELEETLRSSFPDDQIEPIEKGKNGADVRQRVFNTRGVESGKIIWESKRTKNWTEGWVPKLKEDLRAEKGDLAVLVTTTMPKTVDKKFAFYQGIWLCVPELATFIAQLLRFNLIRIGFVVDSQASKDEKVEALYRYLTGPEFSQKIESQYETIAAMREELEKEKTFWKRHFASREKQIDSLQTSVITMYGGLQGVTQNALPTVKLLEGE